MGIQKEIIGLIRSVKKELAIKIFVIVLVSTTYIVQAFAMGKTVNIIFGEEPFTDIIKFVGTVFLCVCIRTGMTYFLEIYNVKIGAAVKTHIREELFDKVLDLGPGYIMDQRSGKLQSVLMDGVENLEPYLVGFLPQIVAVAIVGSVLGIVSCWLDPVVGMMMIITMIICVIVPYITLPLVRKSYIGYWKEYAFMNAQYIDAIQGITTLKAFHSSKDKGKELEENAQHFYRTQLHNTCFSVMDSGIMMFLTSVIGYAALGIAAYRTDMGLLASTTVPLFLFLTSECARPMMELNKAWHSSMMGMSASETILEFLKEKRQQYHSDQPLFSGLEGDTAEIEFDHVTFQYPKGKKPALQDVSMKIRKGQSVAVVGMSGSGKSTLANLLFRFYDIQKGTIRINGIDIREFDLGYLRQHLSVVFQENYLMQGSIADNIRMADTKAGKKEVKAAASAAGADEFIEQLNDGYHTAIGERGDTLSGGQKQRIAIARSLMKKAPVRIFDEATSNVDAISEAKIKKAMDQLAGTATTLMIAHRLSTVKNADYIYVLDEGRVCEEGTHQELIRKRGRYYDLVQKQLGGVS